MEKAYVNGQQKDFSTMKKIGSKTVDGTTFTMYVSKNNKYYVHCSGDNSDASNMDFSTAKQWAKENLTPDEYANAFENNHILNTELVVCVDGNAATEIERIRGNTGMTYGEIIEKAVDYLSACSPCK